MRIICLLLFSSSLLWYFFPIYNWLIYHFYFLLTLLVVGIVFTRNKLFFLLLAIFLFYYHHWLLAPDSSEELAICDYRPEVVEGVLVHREGKEVLLSRPTFFCKNRVIQIPTALYFLKRKSDYYFVFPGQKIRILNPQVSIEAKKVILRNSRYSRTFNLSLRQRKENRSPLWHRLKNKSSYYLQNEAQGLYQAVFLTDKSALNRKFRRAIRDIGISHLFAISGLHTGMIFLWTRFFWGGIMTFLFAWFKKQRNIWIGIDFLSLSTVLFYLKFIDFPITAVRAWWMLCIFLLNHHLFHWLPSRIILLLVAIFILLKEPEAIFSIGFQLSFLAVLTILAFSNLFQIFNERAWWKKMLWSYLDTTKISIFISLFSLPIVLEIFGKLNILGVLLNPLHIFFLGLLYLPMVIIGVLTNYFLGNEEIYFYCMQQIGNFWAASIQYQAAVSEPLALKRGEGIGYQVAILVYSLFLVIALAFAIFKEDRKKKFLLPNNKNFNK